MIVQPIHINAFTTLCPIYGVTKTKLTHTLRRTDDVRHAILKQLLNVFLFVFVRLA